MTGRNQRSAISQHDLMNGMRVNKVSHDQCGMEVMEEGEGNHGSNLEA